VPSPRARAIRWAALPLVASLLLLAARFASTSGQVWDVVAGAWAPGFRLKVPFWHVVFAPLNGFADMATALSLRQGIVLLAWFLLGYLAWRGLRWARQQTRRPSWLRAAASEAAMLLAFLLALGGLVAWVALGSRPMTFLTAADPDTLLVDLHSHTSSSWDGRKSFTWRENMRWHEAQGFNAGFITDHNVFDAAQAAWESDPPDAGHGYISLRGEEMSMWRQHIVLLGVHEWVAQRPWDERELLRPFIDRERAQGMVVQLSLPEYWLHHWGAGLDQFFGGGVHGVEIFNCAPRALDFPPAYRRQVIERCREENLYVAGVTDNHGFGSSTSVWNAMRIPDWRKMDPGTLENAILGTLKEKGFHAVQVLTRYNFAPETTLALLLSPATAAIALLRSLSPVQTLSWLLWVWGLWLLAGAVRRRAARRITAHHGAETR
jgi:hypothetical protein